MTDNVAHLILEQLKVLRNELRDFQAEMRSELETVKTRLGSLELSSAP